jgi:methionine sulfoxide reductase heme-binding subunit
MRSLLLPKALVHAAALLPAVLLGADVWNDALGADPVAEITHRTGSWGLRLLLLALAVTPLRRLTGWSVLGRFRRLVGLYAFFYACLHLSTYVVLDLGGYWAQVLEDVVKRPYITLGFLAWLGLLLLAATSTQGMVRRLGRRWAQLHRIVYGVGILAVLHFLWLVKSDYREPLLYAAILAALLLLRLPPIARRIDARQRAARRSARTGSAERVLQRGP